MRKCAASVKTEVLRKQFNEGLCVCPFNRVPFFGFGSVIECQLSFVSSLNRVRF